MIDNWKKQSYSAKLVDHYFEKGKTYAENKIREAVQLAANSDAAIIAAGIEEGEFNDRTMLTLPGLQEEMNKRISATGKPVVVLLVGGSAITMNNRIRKVPASFLLLQQWSYPNLRMLMHC